MVEKVVKRLAKLQVMVRQPVTTNIIVTEPNNIAAMPNIKRPTAFIIP